MTACGDQRPSGALSTRSRGPLTCSRPVDDDEWRLFQRHRRRMPTAAHRPEALRGRVFRGSTTVASGLITKKQLRSSAWVRLRQDVYADAALPVTHRVLISAVGLCLPDGAGFTG